MAVKIIKELDHKLKWDIFWVGVIQVANYIFPFLTTTYLIRTIGIPLFGKTEFATLLILYFVVITNYEFHITGTRQISRWRDDPEKTTRYINTLITTKLYLFLLSTFLFTLMLLIWPEQFYNWLFVSTYLIVIGHLLYQPFIFQGFGKLRTLAILNFAIKAISTLLIFLVIHSKEEYEMVNLNYSISFILIGLISLVLSIRHFKISFRWQKFSAVRNCLKDGLFIFLTNGVIAQITLNLSAILLAFFLDASVLGNYAAALKIIVALNVLSLMPLKQVFFPALAHSWIHDRTDYQKKFKAYTSLIVLSTLLVAAGILLFAPYIIKLFYGAYYSEMIYVMRMLAFLPLLTGLINTYISDGLLVMGKDRLVFTIQLSATLLNVVLLLTSIPLFGLTGALIIRIVIDALTLLTGIIIYYRSLKHARMEGAHQ
jgi:PST family polysaccharide transporter